MHVDINKHRQHMGMVFQQFNLFNNKTVLQNIMLAPVYINTKKAGGLFAPSAVKKQIKQQAYDRAMDLLRRIGLEEKADVYPSTLSGGQKQRIAIIRALAMNPDVMLFGDGPITIGDNVSIGNGCLSAELLKLILENGEGIA